MSSGKIIISRHIDFDEPQFPLYKNHTPPITTYDFIDKGLNPNLHHLIIHQPTPIHEEQEVVHSLVAPSTVAQYMPSSSPSQITRYLFMNISNDTVMQDMPVP